VRAKKYCPSLGVVVQVARVVGQVVTTIKDAGLVGRPLLLIQPVGARGEDTGRPLVASDAVGAGAGEHVFYVRGAEASFPFLPDIVPTDASIVGIVDEWEVG
jgi:microcompartment protein CcmK/EutM